MSSSDGYSTSRAAGVMASPKPECSNDGAGCRLAIAQQIKIAGRTVRRWSPQAEEHSAFQNEAITVRCDAETVQQPLDGIARQHQLDIVGIGASTLREAVPHRRTNIARPVPGYAAHSAISM
jgi:hypothetical protein